MTASQLRCQRHHRQLDSRRSREGGRRSQLRPRGWADEGQRRNTRFFLPASRLLHTRAEESRGCTPVAAHPEAGPTANRDGTVAGAARWEIITTALAVLGFSVGVDGVFPKGTVCGLFERSLFSAFSSRTSLTQAPTRFASPMSPSISRDEQSERRLALRVVNDTWFPLYPQQQSRRARRTRHVARERRTRR